MRWFSRGAAGALLLGVVGCGGSVVRGGGGDAAVDDRPTITPPVDAGPIVSIDASVPRDAPLPVRDAATPDRVIPARDVPPAPDAGGAVVAGARCEDDAMCGPLQCAFGNAPFCTGPCSPSGDADPDARAREEQRECGPGGACLALGDDGSGPVGICLAGCRTGVNPGSPGACRDGFVCTGQWLRQPDGVPDNPACFPFCRTDDQCEDGGRCNPRTGQCDSDGLVPTRLPDGAPCDPTRTEVRPGEDTPRNVQCRGVCFLVSGTTRSQGICGSLLDLARSPACPDDPMRITPRFPAAGDDQAVCVFRSCVSNADCTSPLRCVWPERMGVPAMDQPRRCSYPTAAQPDGVADAGVAPDA
ncbi:MAG: hypothetical protein U0325_14860 [Polyangiales bacterium]